MCTVVFIPQKEHFIFTSLRDENPQRPKALSPVHRKIGARCMVAPQDALSGGTWLGVNDIGNLVILLNGAFKSHIRQPKYRQSRGLVVPELLSTTDMLKTFEGMSLYDIEPFTLIVWFHKRLYQLTWDGYQKFIKSLSAERSQIWSSSTLYSPEIKTYRESLFTDWINERENIDDTDVLNFFKSYNDYHNGFIMNRSNVVKTLSFTCINLTVDEGATIRYTDFENQTTYTTEMQFVHSGATHQDSFNHCERTTRTAL